MTYNMSVHTPITLISQCILNFKMSVFNILILKGVSCSNCSFLFMLPSVKIKISDPTCVSGHVLPERRNAKCFIMVSPYNKATLRFSIMLFRPVNTNILMQFFFFQVFCPKQEQRPILYMHIYLFNVV